MDHQGDIGHGIANPSGRLSSVSASDPVVYRSFCLDGLDAVEVRRRDFALSVSAGQERNATFQLTMSGSHAQIEIVDISRDVANRWRLVSAVFEYLFATSPALQALALEGEAWFGIRDELSRNEIWLHENEAARQLILFANMFWQATGVWTSSASTAFPRHDIFDGRIAHPWRPPKPRGTVYARYILWLGGVFSLDVATFDDLPIVHRWMNDPRVNEFWHEAGDEDRHRRYLAGMFADPHIMPLIGRFDCKAFAYFEVYWAKEDSVGTFCDAGDYDRGCHVIVGDDACRGRDWFTAWLPSLLHYMFLDDPRTQSIVQEPSSNHHRQLRNLQKSGFSHVKSVNLPTKHAAIMAITRQRFFSDRLWHAAD